VKIRSGGEGDIYHSPFTTERTGGGTMNSLWEKVKKGVFAGASVTAEKAGELSRIGKMRLDIAGVKRNINKTFTELGGLVYHLLVEEKAAKIADQEEVKRLVEQVKMSELDLQAKEAELEAIRSQRKEKGEEEKGGEEVVSEA